MEIELSLAMDRHIENASLKRFLFRAVKELLFNIFKHAGEKSARVHLYGNEDTLTIDVIDSGRGFDPEALNRITAQRGFGLMTIRERASFMGGSLLISSAPGQGSRFTLTVPLDVAVDDEPLQWASVRE